MFEPNGIRGVAVTLKGLVDISRTCPDLLVAVKHGLGYFASKLPALPVEGDWDAFFSDPYSKSIRIPELKRLMKGYRCLRTTGTKAGKHSQFYF